MHMPSLFSLSLFFRAAPIAWHLQVPRLGVLSELQLLAYATATAMPDPSYTATSVTYTTALSNARSFNPLSEATNPHLHGY